MPRIGLIFNHAEIVGGGELSFLDLAAALPAQGFTPVVVVPADGEVARRAAAFGLEVKHTPFPRLRLLSVHHALDRILALRALFRSWQLDLVHANGARCMLYAGPAARLAGLPCLWHVRVLERDRGLDRVRAVFATRIIANSLAVADTLAGIGVRRKRIEVIYNGLDLKRIDAMPAINLRALLGLPDQPVVVAVGRLCAWKGFEDLIQACQMLRAQGRRFQCVIIGSAVPLEKDYESRLKELPKALGLDNVHFFPWRDDALSCVKTADVMVVPSHGEPFGRVVIEAWACGVPLIVTNAGGPAELVTHDVDGCLVPVRSSNRLAEAMEALLADSSKSERLSKHGRERSRSFDLVTHVKRVTALYPPPKTPTTLCRG